MVQSRCNAGWHSRGYLPHFDQPGAVQSITFRLADALPAHLGSEWTACVVDRNTLARRERVETALDQGYGACVLRDPRVARLVGAALLHFDGVRYHLREWVVMPNHVHVLIETLGAQASSLHSPEGSFAAAARMTALPGECSLASITHSWKSFTANRINRILHRTGRLWQPEYFDRAIRDEEHLRVAREYIQNNPVKAGLVERVEDWPYGSAAGTRPR
jgi:REP element-mobilizing transposase RayT